MFLSSILPLKSVTCLRLIPKPYFTINLSSKIQIANKDLSGVTLESCVLPKLDLAGVLVERTHFVKIDLKNHDFSQVQNRTLTKCSVKLFVVAS